jgi:hypothetical protein
MAALKKPRELGEDAIIEKGADGLRPVPGMNVMI